MRVTPEFLIELFRHGSVHHFCVESEGLPLDARMAGIGRWGEVYNPQNHTIDLVIESESFDEVPEGTLLPILPPTLFRTIEP